MQWRTFLRAHWSALLAADFFTTEVWTVRGLVTYYTVFVIELQTRRVHVLGSTPYPDEAFVIQTMRDLTDPVSGILRARSILICDRDRKWSVAVQHFLATAGVRVVQTPFRAPNCNAHADRFVRAIKEECLNKVIPSVNAIFAGRWPTSSPTITVNATIKVSATRLSTPCGNSLPAVSFVAGSDSADF